MVLVVLVYGLYFTFNKEHERERFVAKCTMLQKKNAEMSKRMAELEEVIACCCALVLFGKFLNQFTNSISGGLF